MKRWCVLCVGQAGQNVSLSRGGLHATLRQFVQGLARQSGSAIRRPVALLQRRGATCVRRVDSLPKWEVAPNARVHVHREDFHLKKGKTPAARVNGVERGRIPMNWLNPVAALVHWAGTRPKNRYRPLQDVRSVLRGGIAPKLDRWSVSCYRRPCT